MRNKKLKYLSIVSFLIILILLMNIIIYNKQISQFLEIYFNNKPSAQTSNNTSEVSLENKPTISNSKIFYGVSLDMSQILPASKNYVKNKKNEDLVDISHDLGVNLIRITNVNKSFNNENVVYTKKQWDQVLDKMNDKGIKAIILVESPTAIPNDYSKNYIKLVKNYILDSGVAQNPAVYAIDIKNEPLISYENVKAMESASKMIKDKYPDMKITVGGWKTLNPDSKPGDLDPYIWQSPQLADKLNNFIDFYSLHLYEYDKSLLGKYPNPYNLTAFHINKLKDSLGGKPILIEEFGAGNGNEITDQQTLGNNELQANIYTGIYKYILENAQKENLLGSVAYTLYPRDYNTNGWNIVDKNFTPLPAALVLQKFANGENVESQPSNSDTSKVYLLSGKDNNRIISLNKNDILGFRIILDPKKLNSIKITNSGILEETQSLTKENNNDVYDAVFKAVKSGKTSITAVDRSTGITKFKITVEVK